MKRERMGTTLGRHTIVMVARTTSPPVGESQTSRPKRPAVVSLTSGRVWRVSGVDTVVTNDLWKTGVMMTKSSLPRQYPTHFRIAPMVAVRNVTSSCPPTPEFDGLVGAIWIPVRTPPSPPYSRATWIDQTKKSLETIGLRYRIFL